VAFFQFYLRGMNHGDPPVVLQRVCDDGDVNAAVNLAAQG